MRFGLRVAPGASGAAAEPKLNAGGVGRPAVECGMEKEATGEPAG